MTDTVPLEAVECVTNLAAAKMNSERKITYTQTYEISTRVSADVDSKGMVKPSARVAITRKLEGSEEISELIHADISRGIEEVTEAIQEIRKRGGK